MEARVVPSIFSFHTRIVLLLLLISKPTSSANATTDLDSWATRLPTTNKPLKEHVTRLHFYLHDTVSGRTPTTVQIAAAASTKTSPTSFGLLMMADDPLTTGPDPSSPTIGRVQGMYGLAGQTAHDFGLLMAMSFWFTSGEYNGSSLSLVGRNAAFHPVREIPIVGGTGVFRMARGVAQAKSYLYNETTGDATVEYTVVAMHYSEVE